MSGFLKVRSATGPDAEFFAPAGWVDAHPTDYKVLDKKPVDSVPAVVAVPVTPNGRASKSVGNTKKEGAE